MDNTGDYNPKRIYNAGVYLPKGADQGTGLTVPISINLPSPLSQNIKFSCPPPQNIVVELKTGKGKSKIKNVKGCKGAARIPHTRGEVEGMEGVDYTPPLAELMSRSPSPPTPQFSLEFG